MGDGAQGLAVVSVDDDLAAAYGLIAGAGDHVGDRADGRATGRAHVLDREPLRRHGRPVSNLAWAQLALDRADVSLDLIGRAKARVRRHQIPAGLRFVHGWVLLAIGDPSAAVAEFNHIIAANEDALDGRWLATVYVGAACGLAALQHPSAPELLSGAEANWARLGTVATPWQEPLLAAARERAAEIGPPPWGAEKAPGPTLAALVQAAARTIAGSGTGPTTRPATR